MLGSRGAVMGGGAVGSAAQKLRVQLLEVASMLLQQDADRLQLCDGVISGIGASGSTITFAELARALPGETRFVAEAAYDAERASYSNACAVAVVAVHRATGKVRVDHIAAAEDAGTMLNPLVVEGQFIGGALQGVGMALSEQLKFDETGMPLTATLLDYCLPTASDTPAFRLAHVETPSAYTWAGVKGIGETGTLAVTAAIAAAVEDALAPIGAFVVRLPLTPEEVWLRIKCPRETVQ